MTERDFNNEAYHNAHRTRLNELFERSEQDGIAPHEVIRRIIQEAIQRGDPYINVEDPFVVLGNDGFDMSWFTAGSFKTIPEAITHIEQLQSEEPQYSDGEELATTFHAFTREGIQVRHVPGDDSLTTQ